MTTADKYISRDEIRFKLLSDEDDYFAHENEVFKIFISEIHSAIDKNYDNIFIDATHLNKNSRNKLLYAIGDDYINKAEEINVIFLNTSVITAITRNKQREGRKYVPEEVIYNMFKNLRLPDRDETKITSVYIIEEEKPIERRFINGK